MSDISTWISNLSCLKTNPSLSKCVFPKLLCFSKLQLHSLCCSGQNTWSCPRSTFLPSNSIDLISKSWQLYLQYVFIIQPLLTTSSYPLVQGFPDLDHRSSLLSNLQLSPTSFLQSVLYKAVREIRLFHSSAQNSPWFLFSFRVKAQILSRASKSLCDMTLPTSLPPPSVALSSLTTLAFLLVLRKEKLLSTFRAFQLALPLPRMYLPPDLPVSRSSTSRKCRRGRP